MLGLFKNKESMDEKIKKDMEKKREKIIHRATMLRKLTTDEASGWSDYVELLKEYVQACKKRKAVTALDTASDQTLAQLKLLDHEVWLIETFILKIPQQIFDLEKRTEEKTEEGNDD